MRRIARTAGFEMSLQLRQDSFIATPRESQRNWLVAKAVAEFGRDLGALDAAARAFVPGAAAGHDQIDRLNGALTDAQIMEQWQVPLMEAMADIVTATHGHVLEIGFGRGVSADLIQSRGVSAHTIVECNPTIAARFHEWRAHYPVSDIRFIEALWQDAADRFECYDGIFFHAYPLTEQEFVSEAMNSATFAAHFFETAAAHLRPGGVFTYLTHEIDSLSREQQRLLLDHFDEVSVRRVALEVPTDTHDAWWADSMVVVRATARAGAPANA